METDAPLLQFREYRADDMPMVSEWWGDHGHGEFPASLLPPVGVVAEQEGEPIAACWLYMAVGVGVCWLEYPVSKPGLSVRAARTAFAALVGALEDIARTHDYGLMMAHTLPPIARVMEGFGFRTERRHKITVMKPLKEAQ